MKDNISETIQFIQEIEKFPQLYDHTLTEYSNRRTTEMSWAKIAIKFDATGDTCKSKWKGIRSSYIRSLNTKGKSGSGAGSKKPYYLAQYLKFLDVFKKNYPQEGNLKPVTSNQEPENLDGESQVSDEETATLEADSQNSDANLFSRDTEFSTDFDDLDESQDSLPSGISAVAPSTSYTTDKQSDVISPVSPALPIKLTGKRLTKKSCNTRGLSALDKCAIDYFNVKRKKAETVTCSSQSQKDPCELFLLSLVPQMKSMTPRQQLSFQKGILELIEKIKYPQDHPLPSIPGQQVVYPASANAGSYYNAFGTGYEEQQDTNLLDLTPAQSSHSHTHSQY